MASWMSDELNSLIDSLDEPVKSAVDILLSHGQTDGDHHKMWAIDQAVRVLTGERYQAFIDAYQGNGYDDEIIYEWDTGIAP